MTAAVCDCFTWAGDMRVGQPNGHHPRCPQQPTPSSMVSMKIAPELLVQEWLKLPNARLIDARVKRTYITDAGTLVLDLDVQGAPLGAKQMCPVYTTTGPGEYRMSQIDWHMVDGSTQRQVCEPDDVLERDCE